LTSESERAAEVKRLFDVGFKEFKTYALVKQGDVVGEAEVWAGEERSVALTVREPVNVMLRRVSRSGLRVTLKYDEPVLAPVEKGAKLGSLVVSAPGVPDRTVPVYAAAPVESGGIFTHMRLGLNALFSDDSKPAQPQSETTATPDASR
jgi:D-alanyl-D-alanine carboxypeptidase (penicillin-binding protein 5/6)